MAVSVAEEEEVEVVVDHGVGHEVAAMMENHAAEQVSGNNALEARLSSLEAQASSKKR